MPPRHIFTYGSLMFPEVWHDVVKQRYESQSAWVDGFRRTCIQDDNYPVVLPRSGQKDLEGVVYFSVKSQDIARLDRFEGDYYFRRRIRPRILLDGDAKTIEADLYVLKPKYAELASLRPWDPEFFERREMRFFRKKYSGF
jgi:gamma-glutamylcyclotransferase (GGCT)/AIG2-like uncharacterized protein YtfP